MILFGKAKKGNASPKQSIVQLRETLDMLEKREEFLRNRVEHEIKTARANGMKNKKVAMMALKRKNAYQEQINRIAGSRLTVESQVMTLENATVNLEAINAMKSGADAMKSIHGRVDIDQVDNTMDDIRDQVDLANEISDAISQPLGMGLDIDEDDLLQELDELEELNFREQFESEDKVSYEKDVELAESGEELPNVPQSEPLIALPPRPSKVLMDADEDAELSELRASMAS